jgi:hypothetical protein
MDKELLFKSRVPEGEIELSGIGTIRVRGLTRAEAFLLQQLNNTEIIERRMIAITMVDPPLTESEVGKWQKASSAGELEAVTSKIQQLSGMGDAATKAVYKSDGEQS